MIKEVLSHKMNYLFVAKPSDHQYMMEWITAYDTLPEITAQDIKGPSRIKLDTYSTF